jgi:hypothetical protein
MDIVSVDCFDRNSVVHNLDKNSCMASSNIWDDLEQNCQFSTIELDSILAISLHDSSSRTWGGPIADGSDEGGHLLQLVDLVNYNQSTPYNRDTIAAFVPEQMQLCDAALFSISKPAATQDLEIEGTQPYFSGRPKSRQGAKEFNTTSSTQKRSRQKNVAFSQAGRSKRRKSLEQNRTASSRCRQKKKEEIQILKEIHRQLLRQRSTLKQEVQCLTDDLLQLKVVLLKHSDCDYPVLKYGRESEEKESIGSRPNWPHLPNRDVFSNDGCEDGTESSPSTLYAGPFSLDSRECGNLEAQTQHPTGGDLVGSLSDVSQWWFPTTSQREVGEQGGSISSLSNFGIGVFDLHQGLQEEYSDDDGYCDASLCQEGSAREMLFRLQDSLLKHAREELAKSTAAA